MLLFSKSVHSNRLSIIFPETSKHFLANCTDESFSYSPHLLQSMRMGRNFGVHKIFKKWRFWEPPKIIILMIFGHLWGFRPSKSSSSVPARVPQLAALSEYTYNDSYSIYLCSLRVIRGQHWASFRPPQEKTNFWKISPYALVLAIPMFNLNETNFSMNFKAFSGELYEWEC